MKIAYISHHNRPCYEYNWLKSIEVDKIQFIDTDFSKYPKNPNNKIEYRKVDYKENKLANKFLHSTASIVTYYNFENYLKNTDIIVTLEVFSSLSRQFINYAKKNNKKSAVIVYELIAEHPIYKLPLQRSNTKYVFSNADVFICITNKAKDHLIQLGCPKEKIRVVYPGIDLSIFSCDKKISDNEINLIYTGKLESHKGIADLLNVFERINSANNNIILTICGDGSYRDIVVKYCKKSKNIKYLGNVGNLGLPKILCQNDIFLFPAKDTFKFGYKIGAEQFGFSIVEAMACGLPVVAYDCGAIKEIIGNDNFVLKQGDVQSFQNAVQKLIDNKNLINKISANNIYRAKEKFNILKQAKLLLQIFYEK